MMSGHCSPQSRGAGKDCETVTDFPAQRVEELQ